MKVFVLISVGSWGPIPANFEEDGVYRHYEDKLHIYKDDDGKFGVTEACALGYLRDLRWIPENEYLPFIQNAEVGEMILLKNIYALIRLKDYSE
jgi:hypothetical protein